jgi:hypothetical protein
MDAAYVFDIEISPSGRILNWRTTRASRSLLQGKSLSIGGVRRSLPVSMNPGFIPDYLWFWPTANKPMLVAEDEWKSVLAHYHGIPCQCIRACVASWCTTSQNIPNFDLIQNHDRILNARTSVVVASWSLLCKKLTSLIINLRWIHFVVNAIENIACGTSSIHRGYRYNSCT